MSDSAAAPREGRPVRSVTVAAVLFLVLLLATAGARSWRDLGQARGRQAELETKIEETEARIEALDRRIRRLRSDPLLLERLAREELGLAREGEVVFVLPRREPRAGSVNPAEAPAPPRPPGGPPPG